MKWLKKWLYMLLWIVAGVIYLSAADGWQVYAKTIEQAKNWYESSKQNMDILRTDDIETNGQSLWNTVSGTEGVTVSGTEGITVSGAEGATVSGTEAVTVSGTDGITVSAGDDAAAAEPSEEAAEESLPEESEHDGMFTYCTVEDDYFADAVFIGDSRTVGMFEYGGLEETADFYASTGLTIYKLFDAEIVAVEGQKKKITVEQALSENSYAKIYLMIGINEMGTGTVETFTAAYQEAADHLLELQPDAILYIQGIMKVTTERSEQGDYINNEGIEARNEALAQLADNERIFYLDVNPEICDETGGMEASYTFDGVHLKAQYIDIWKTFLKEHAVLR